MNKKTMILFCILVGVVSWAMGFTVHLATTEAETKVVTKTSEVCIQVLEMAGELILNQDLTIGKLLDSAIAANNYNYVKATRLLDEVEVLMNSQPDVEDYTNLAETCLTANA